jgi:hypothetical protein
VNLRGYNRRPANVWKVQFIITIILSEARLSPIGTAATMGLLYQPQMTEDGDCGKIGGMIIGRGNRSTRRKPAPVPLCSPQIPHYQTRARNRAATVGAQRRTAWAMTWPKGTVDCPIGGDMGMRTYEQKFKFWIHRPSGYFYKPN